VDCELWVVEKEATALEGARLDAVTRRSSRRPSHCVVVFCGGAGNLELCAAPGEVWLSYEGDERQSDRSRSAGTVNTYGLAKDCDLNGGSRNLSAMSRTSSGSVGKLH